MKDWIRCVVEDGVATLTLNRPEKRNAMSHEMLLDFLGAIERAGEDPSVRVLIITGSGGSFCAGADLSDFAKVAESGEERPAAAERGRWWHLVHCPKPVIGAIDGPAIGMGAEFSSLCDVRIATPKSRFAWNFAQRGLIPDTGAGSWLLPRLIGPARAFHLLYSGEFLSAEDAHAIGYVNEIHEPEGLLPRALELAKLYMQSSPFAQSRIKELVYEGFTCDIDDHTARSDSFLNECFDSDDHKEGVAAFFERREARFTGR
jgi:enoyl-CoA hydratase/carnithine racemase